MGVAEGYVMAYRCQVVMKCEDSQLLRHGQSEIPTLAENFKSKRCA